MGLGQNYQSQSKIEIYKSNCYLKVKHKYINIIHL